MLGDPARRWSPHRALELDDDDPDLTIATRYFGAQAAYSSGDYAGAIARLRELIATLEARDPGAWTGTPGPSIIFFRAWLIWSLSRLGDAGEAEIVAGTMRRLADDAGLPLCRTIAHLSEGIRARISRVGWRRRKRPCV